MSQSQYIEICILYNRRDRDPTKIDRSVVEIKPLTVVTTEDMCNFPNIALMFFLNDLYGNETYGFIIFSD